MKPLMVRWDMVEEPPQNLLEKFAIASGNWGSYIEEKKYLKELSHEDQLAYLKERYKDTILECI